MKSRLVGATLLAITALTISACGSSSTGIAATTTSAAAPALSSAASALSSVKSSAAGAASSAMSSAAAAVSSARSAISGAVASATAGTGSGAATYDVCTILPFAQAAQLSGQPYTQGESTTSDGLYGCAYDNDDATVPGVNVTILADPDGDTWAAVHIDGVTDVSGLGDKALWDNDNTLYVVKGDYVVQVNGDDLTQNVAQALAKPVIGALP